MQKNRKLQTEYIFLAVIFASVIWGIFAGFRIVRYQWIMIIGGVMIFLGICALWDYHKQSIYVMLGICGMFLILFHSQLINGFRIINNKMALALNQSMDLGFYYYISVQMEHSRRDSALAVIFFLLITGIILSFLRYRPLILFVVTGVMECMVLAVAPYSISSVFFLFLGTWIAYFSLHKGKKSFGLIIYILCFCAMLPLYYHDQTTVPSDTMVKRNLLIGIRKLTQGESYLAVGGLGNGDIGSVGEVSPTGEKLFQVYAPEKDDLYLKSYVSGVYKNGKWTDDSSDTLVYGGETAIGLPYLFPELRMDDFVTYPKGYIKTEKDIIFSEKRNLKIRYQKKQDTYLLFPYFCDTSEITGNIIGDRVVKRTTDQKDYDMTYYEMKDLRKMLKASQKLDFTKINGKKSSIERDYVSAMDDYGQYVRDQYLEVPEDIKKCLNTLDLKIDKNDTILKNVENISNYLKSHYEYTYRPGLTLQGKDPVIYFLKDRKKGFCTQYASAAVFMMRQAGIPARYVEGYKVRSSQWKLGKAQVTDYEAHAWVEIYLDDIGWIPVDVTGSYNTGKKAYEHVEKEEKQKNAIVPNRKQFVTNVKKVLNFMPIVLIALLVIILTKVLQKKRAWKYMTNKQKVLYYENKLRKYDENTEKPSETADRVTFEIVEKAKFSEKDITEQEVAIVKRHLDLLKRKNRNVTKILIKLK